MTYEKRNPAIDIAKGIAITCITIGHAITGGEGPGYLEVKKMMLGGFPVCLFFIIGGFLVQQRVQTYSIARFISKRANQIILPYFAFMLLYMVNNYFFFTLTSALGRTPFYPGIGLQHIYLKDIISAFLLSTSHHLILAGLPGMLYFLPVYMVSCVLFYIVMRASPSMLKCIVLIFASPLVSWLLTTYAAAVNIPWGINIALFIMPLMFLGTYYQRIENALTRLLEGHKVIFLISIVVCLLMLLLLYHRGGALWDFVIPYPFSYYVIAVIGFILITCLALFICDTPLKHAVVLAGRYSLPIYGLHFFIINYYTIIYHRIQIRFGFSPGFANNDVTIIASLCILTLLCLAVPVFLSTRIVEKGKILRRIMLGR